MQRRIAVKTVSELPLLAWKWPAYRALSKSYFLWTKAVRRD